jgi:hypothetical protein
MAKNFLKINGRHYARISDSNRINTKTQTNTKNKKERERNPSIFSPNQKQREFF